ncbi:MAG: hypothetical protein RLZZ165_1462 [Bacteroidota bacterium]|jgi:hypothetical protein
MENHTPLQPKPKQNAEGSMGEHTSMEGLSSERSASFSAGRPEIVARKKLQEGINNSPQVQQFRALQLAANNSPQVKAAAQLQRVATAANAAAVQRKQREMEQGGGADSAQLKDKDTGLPTQLKAGIEHMSGMSMDNVKVHYNSSEPAQLQAHAFAQGENIHVAPGQEKHLGHEAWHVVQQKQGRVQPTTQMKGTVPINDDAGLEREADIKGAEAASVGGNVLQNKTFTSLSNPSAPTQLKVAQLISGERKIANIQNLTAPPAGYQAILDQINSKLPSIPVEDRERIGQKTDDTTESRFEKTATFKARMVREAQKLLDALNGYTSQKAATIAAVEGWLGEKAGNIKRNQTILANFKALTPIQKTRAFRTMGQKAYYDDVSTWKTFLSPSFNELIVGIRQATQVAPDAAVEADAGESNRSEMASGVFEAASSITEAVGELDGGKDDKGNDQTLADVNPNLGAIQGGADLATGAFGIYSAVNDFRDPEAGKFDKAKAVVSGVDSAGSMVSGAWDIAGAIDKIKNPLEKDQNAVAQSGIAGAVSSGLTAVTGTLDLLETGYNYFSKDGKTSGEMTEGALEIGSKAASLGKSGADLGKSILSAAGTTTGATVTALGTASAALGVITGTIDMVIGVVQIVRAALSNNDIKKGEAAQATMVQGINTALIQTLEEMKVSRNAKAYSSLIREMRRLRKVLAEIKAVENEFGPAMKAMKMVNGRKMERGALKTVSGALAVTGSALTLSGVGAPVGIAIAAVAGLISLGGLAVNWRRNEAANRLTKIAGMLTDSGTVTDQRAAEAPGFRTMENRIYKYYYKHLDQVIDREAPADMTEDEFTDIQRFNWQEKKDRVPKEKVTTLQPGKDASSLGDTEKRNTWVKKGSGKAVKSERPDSWSWENFKLETSASAHKSKQAEEASKEEITDAVYRLGSSSWNGTEFVPAPLVLLGGGGEEAKAYAHITLTSLLSAASITPAKWKSWKAKADLKPTPADQETEMRKSISNQL